MVQKAQNLLCYFFSFFFRKFHNNSYSVLFLNLSYSIGKNIGKIKYNWESSEVSKEQLEKAKDYENALDLYHKRK
jgi:hypothetical protein